MLLLKLRATAAAAGCLRCQRVRQLATGGGNGDNGDAVFDLAVLGGGSGGLACAKEAADLGARVCVFDYVAPSPTLGTTWGLGGTCVNVGCIPKKLMHLAALHGEALRDASAYGWLTPEAAPAHDWSALSDAVRQHVKSLNFGHRGQLMQRNVEYCNMLAGFVGGGGGGSGNNKEQQQQLLTVSGANPKTGRSRTVRAANAVIAVGGRPTLPAGVAGAAELGLTSDDLFWLPEPPGRTLVVGGGYVALECAGFLAGLGQPAEAMVRTDVCLRGFDQQMAGLVTDYMRQHCGVRFRLGCRPVALREADEAEGGEAGALDGGSRKRRRRRIKVTWLEGDAGTESSGVYDTVLFATGRRPATEALNLSSIGVATDELGRVVGGHRGELERTPVGGVYAIGDALKDGIELTPVAVRAGKLLARRLFGDQSQAGNRTAMMNYDCVPTTVFTPLEYACVGQSEEAALARWGEAAVEVYHAVYTPYEFVLPHRDQSQCYVKAVCGPEEGGCGGGGGAVNRRPLAGLHITGPNAGEILQGFAALMLRPGGATLADLTDAVGIHPTSAEEATKLWISKRSGLSPQLTGC